MNPRFLDAKAAALHVGYADADGHVGAEHLKRFYDWATRAGVKKYHAGRALRFKVEDLDAALEGRDVFVERALHMVGSHGRQR